MISGEHNTQLAEGSEQWIQVSQIIVHENYVKRTADNDIGLLRLAAPIVYTPYAVPACLPTRPLAERVLWAVAKHTVSGWGRRSENGPTSTVLRRLAVPRIRTQVCVEESGVEITDNMFCAGYIEGLQDSCKGDQFIHIFIYYCGCVCVCVCVPVLLYSWGPKTRDYIILMGSAQPRGDQNAGPQEFKGLFEG